MGGDLVARECIRDDRDTSSYDTDRAQNDWIRQITQKCSEAKWNKVNSDGQRRTNTTAELSGGPTARNEGQDNKSTNTKTEQSRASLQIESYEVLFIHGHHSQETMAPDAPSCACAAQTDHSTCCCRSCRLSADRSPGQDRHGFIVCSSHMLCALVLSRKPITAQLAWKINTMGENAVYHQCAGREEMQTAEPAVVFDRMHCGVA